MKSFFNPDAIDILRRDAAEWKRRALVAEGKLSGYQRLREIGDRIIQAICEQKKADRIKATDDLGDELACLEIVDPPHDVFNQIVDLSDELRLHVRTRAGINVCSTMDVLNGLIEIEALQANEGKLIGLVFQLLQVADIVASRRVDREPELSTVHLHEIIPAFLSLLAHLSLLDPRLGITHASIESFCTVLEAERKVQDAASSPG